MDRDVTSRVIVRTARFSDFSALTSLWNSLDELHAAMQPDFFRVAVRDRSHRCFERRLSDPSVLSLVAVLEETIVGVVLATLHETPDEPMLVAMRRVYLDELIVAESVRHSGVGSRLLAEVREWARQRNATQLILTVWEGNDAAVAFYDHHGFCVVGRTLALTM